MATVTAQLVVEFTDPDDTGVLKLEIDSRSDGLNGGVTSFSKGDTIGYLLTKSSNVTLVAHVSSAGNISKVGSGTRTNTEFAVFTSSNKTFSLSNPVSSGFSASFIGASPGTLSLVDGTTVKFTPSPSAPSNYVGVAQISYISAFDEYKLNGLGSETQAVAIVAVGETGS